MRKPTILLIAVLCAFLLQAQDNAEHALKIKFTRIQRQSAGFWRVKIPEPHQGWLPAWLVLYLGDTDNTMSIRYPTGIGCDFVTAEVRGNSIVSTRPNQFEGAIEIHNANSATFSSKINGGVKLEMRKTKESTNFVCE